MFKFLKMYSDMNRKEKREYKRWLKKNKQWDSRVWLENLDKEKAIRDVIN